MYKKTQKQKDNNNNNKQQKQKKLEDANGNCWHNRTIKTRMQKGIETHV